MLFYNFWWTSCNFMVFQFTGIIIPLHMHRKSFNLIIMFSFVIGYFLPLTSIHQASQLLRWCACWIYFDMVLLAMSSHISGIEFSRVLILGYFLFSGYNPSKILWAIPRFFLVLIWIFSKYFWIPLFLFGTFGVSSEYSRP